MPTVKRGNGMGFQFADVLQAHVAPFLEQYVLANNSKMAPHIH
jgi:hypothetical protein